jgi:AraC-like DNA-binding protein
MRKIAEVVNFFNATSPPPTRTHRSIKQIAQEVGFQNEKSFRRFMRVGKGIAEN